MEVLEPSGEFFKRDQIAWDQWLQFDGHVRIVERGVDFSDDPSVVKRQLYTEAARAGYDVVIRLLDGGRIMFQLYEPAGGIPVLPSTPDARKKFPWAIWTNGEWHSIIRGEDFDMDLGAQRAYIYTMARKRGLKVTIYIDKGADTLRFKTYKPTEERPEK